MRRRLSLRVLAAPPPLEAPRFAIYQAAVADGGQKKEQTRLMSQQRRRL